MSSHAPISYCCDKPPNVAPIILGAISVVDYVKTGASIDPPGGDSFPAYPDRGPAPYPAAGAESEVAGDAYNTVQDDGYDPGDGHFQKRKFQFQLQHPTGIFRNFFKAWILKDVSPLIEGDASDIFTPGHTTTSVHATYVWIGTTHPNLADPTKAFDDIANAILSDVYELIADDNTAVRIRIKYSYVPDYEPVDINADGETVGDIANGYPPVY